MAKSLINNTYHQRQRAIWSGGAPLATEYFVGQMVEYNGNLMSCIEDTTNPPVPGNEGWDSMSYSPTLDSSITFPVEGGTVSYKDIGFEIIVYLESVNTFTLPAISSLTNLDFFINLKNDATSTVTINTTGSDTIEGGASITIDNPHSRKLVIKGTDFKIL